MKRPSTEKTKGVDLGPEGYVDPPDGPARRFAATVVYWRRRWGAGRLLNELLENLTVDEVLLLTEAINHGVDPEALNGFPESFPPATDA